MAEEDPAVAIRRLRWPVYIVTREQIPEPGGPGILERLKDDQKVRADVVPVGALTFWATGAFEQTDTGVTHRIFMRWVNYLDQAQMVVRTTRLQDGEVRTEIFRVRRVKELGGRKRFVCLECEMEKAE